MSGAWPFTPPEDWEVIGGGGYFNHLVSLKHTTCGHVIKGNFNLGNGEGRASVYSHECEQGGIS